MTKRRTTTGRGHPLEERDARFSEIVSLIEAARARAYQAVNAELVRLYWSLGEYLSRKIASAEWGSGVVDELASSLARRFPGLRGFTRRNLFRMRQFFEAYASQEKVSAVLTQLPWTHHLIILGQVKPDAAREFYVLAAIRERWSSRELERQIRSAAALRATTPRRKASASLIQAHPEAVGAFKNAYNLEFLALAPTHSEADLHGALLRHLGRFLTELGRDFCFVGSEYPVQLAARTSASTSCSSTAASAASSPSSSRWTAFDRSTSDSSPSTWRRSTGT